MTCTPARSCSTTSSRRAASAGPAGSRPSGAPRACSRSCGRPRAPAPARPAACSTPARAGAWRPSASPGCPSTVPTPSACSATARPPWPGGARRGAVAWPRHSRRAPAPEGCARRTGTCCPSCRAAPRQRLRCGRAARRVHWRRWRAPGPLLASPWLDRAARAAPAPGHRHPDRARPGPVARRPARRRAGRPRPGLRVERGARRVRGHRLDRPGRGRAGDPRAGPRARRRVPRAGAGLRAWRQRRAAGPSRPAGGRRGPPRLAWPSRTARRGPATSPPAGDLHAGGPRPRSCSTCTRAGPPVPPPRRRPAHGAGLVDRCAASRARRLRQRRARRSGHASATDGEALLRSAS